MKTLKEELKERGISFAHVARMNDISTQAVNQYRSSPVVVQYSSYIDVMKKIQHKEIYDSSGKLLKNATYELVRTFDL